MSALSVAFLVGVDQFGDSAFTPLRFCQNDVDGMARVLRNPEISGFDIIEVRNKRHDEVLEGLATTVARLRPGDKLLFYFAGHGCRSAQSGRLYLVATDTKSEALRATGIPIDIVLDIIRESRCDDHALVLDCCHSVAVGEGFRGGDIASGLDERARTNAGTYILTASTAIQLAEERESAAGDGTSGNGIFTKYFIEALETGNARSGDSGEITIDAVHDYIQQRVTSQQPQRFVIGGMGRFVIGRSWERRRAVLRAQFLELLGQNLISARQYAAAAEIFGASWTNLSVDQQGIGRRALDFLDGKLSALEFFSYLNPAAARLAEEEARRKAAAEAQERPRAGEEENRPVHVFCSYRHADRRVLDELRNHLGWLENNEDITVFDDMQITAGDEWDVRIRQELDRADVIILVVSAAFFRSPYCTRMELRQALLLRSSRGVRVLPIIAETCDWAAVPPLQSIAALSKDSDNNLKPLNKWGRNRDVALTQVAQQVRQNVERVRAGRLPNHIA